MKSFIIFLNIIYGLITLNDSQSLTSNTAKIVTYPSSLPLPSFTITVTNVTVPVTVFCSIVLWSQGYSNATVTQTSVTSNVFTFTLSNLREGRVTDIQCGLGSSSSVSNINVGLSVRPNIWAQVCDIVSAIIANDRNTTANVVVRFSYPLTSAASITCTSTSLANGGTASPANNAASITMTLNFTQPLNTSEIVNCTFTMGSVTSNFTFNVTFIKAAITFSPSTIVTDSTFISLNLLINFQPYQIQNLNCSLSSTTVVPVCSAIPPYSRVGNWILTSSVSFPANSPTTTLTISLIKSSSTPGLSENFGVVCCNANYMAVANVTANYPINDNTFQASTGETSYSYVQYYQMSSCPCDLTVQACDLNCCCDPYCDCSPSGVIPISGPFGGYFNDTPQYSCQAPYQATTEPFQALLCVQFNTSNIIGYYYNNTSVIKTSDSFQTTINSANRNSFQFSITSQELSGTNIVAYTFGGSVPSSLFLPRPAVNSVSCNLNSAITFLEPYDAICNITVTKDNCQSSTDLRLSYVNYLLSSTVIESNCISNFSQLKINQNIPVYTFYPSPSTLPSWDNGYNLPSSPILTANTCENVVIAVNYSIAYNGSGLIYINAYVTMGNVVLGNSLSQRFTVSFLSTNISSNLLTSGSILTVQNIVSLSLTSQTKSSGLYGYEDGLPVLLGDNSTMKTFVLDVNGLCPLSTTGGRPVLFGKDSFMQCKYTFSNSACAARRSDAQTYLDSFLTNKLVAIYGSPSSAADYVTVLTIAVTNVTGTGTIPSRNTNASIFYPIDSMTGFCENVITGVNILIYYSRQGKARGQYINNIRGVKKMYVVGNLTNFIPNGPNAQPNTVTFTSTIEFVLVSANIAGDQSTDNIAQKVCNFDVCLDELLYPWLLNYEGKQGFFELSFGVMLLGLAVFLLVTTHPWW